MYANVREFTTQGRRHGAVHSRNSGVIRLPGAMPAAATKSTLLLLLFLINNVGCGRDVDDVNRSVADPIPEAAVAAPLASGPTLATPLACSSGREVQFGIVPAGGRKERMFSLTNPTDAVIEIGDVIISCDCVKVTLAEQSIQPGETTSGTIVLDLREEPESVGKLGVEVEGVADDGGIAFAFTVYVDIQKSGERAGG